MRKYYIPGILSIILLPFLCLCYLNHYNLLNETRGIQVYVDDANKELGCVNSEIYIPFKDVVFTTYLFTGDLENDNILMHNLKNNVQKIIEQDDYVSGVKCIYENKISYSRYI